MKISEELRFKLMSKLKPLISKIEQNRTYKSVTVVLDGRCASGKSTAAKLLSEHFCASVVHTDDFFLPFDKRTQKRLDEPGGNTDYERFKDEVVSRLHEKRDIEYGKFDCSLGRITSRISCAYTDVIIIEGSYSMHPYYGNYGDIYAFFDVDKDEQQRRILERNGAGALEIFNAKWIPLEEKYFEHSRVRERADLVIK